MTKQEKTAVDKFYEDYHIDPRTMGMIANHYIAVGESIWAKITPEDIQATVEDEKKKQAEAEAKGHIYMITPEFTEYLLNACLGLSKLDPFIRHAILRTWL